MSRFQVTIRERNTEPTIFGCPLLLWSYIGSREGRYGSDPFQKCAWIRAAGVIHGDFESTGIIGVCVAIRHHIPNLRAIRGLRTQLEKGGFSEPEVIENASAAKQDTSSEALIQVFFY
jgi:hypothetical protein